jgi:broad-specificity NMP kinase
MIILLTGPTGAGKTDISWALLQQFDRMVFLDCDWFASRVPFAWQNESDVESVFQSLAVMIEFHIKRSEKNFVVTLMLEMAKCFEKYSAYLTRWCLPVKAFRLRCSEQELERRIRGRDRIAWQQQQELSSMLQMQKEFDTLFPTNEIFTLFDTTILSEQEVAARIKYLIESTL